MIDEFYAKKVRIKIDRDFFGDHSERAEEWHKAYNETPSLEDMDPDNIFPTLTEEKWNAMPVWLGVTGSISIVTYGLVTPAITAGLLRSNLARYITIFTEKTINKAVNFGVKRGIGLTLPIGLGELAARSATNEWSVFNNKKYAKYWGKTTLLTTKSHAKT